MLGKVPRENFPGAGWGWGDGEGTAKLSGKAGHPGVGQALPSSPCRWQAEINSSRTTLSGPKGECL